MGILEHGEYRAWEERIPDSIRGDPIWRFFTYRLALYLGDLARDDAIEIRRNRGCLDVADQLLRAGASVSANIAEGYARMTTPDRARLYAIALGSLRECASWYRAAQAQLGWELMERRLALIAELRRMLIGAQRNLKLRSADPRIM